MSKADPTDLCSIDPKVDRAQRKKLAKRWVREALQTVGAARDVVAAHLGKAKGRFARELEPDDEGAAVQLETVIGLPPAARRIITEELAALDGCALAELPDPEWASPDELRRQARLTRELMEVAAHHAESVADGRITAQEAKHGRARVREAIAALLAVDALYQQAEHERVLGVVTDPTTPAAAGANNDKR